MQDAAGLEETSASRSSVAGSVALWIGVVALFLVPLATSNLTGLGVGQLPLTYDSEALPRLVLALVAAPAMWAALLWTALRKGGRVKVDVVVGLLGALALWAAICAAASPHWALGVLGQSERLEGVVTVGLYALLYGAGLQLARRSSDVRRLAAAVGIAGGLAAAYGVLQVLGIDPTIYLQGNAFSAEKASATFGNPNFLAGFLVLAAPLAVGLALTARSKLVAVAWGTVSLLIVTGIVGSYTRGALVALVVEVLLMGWFVVPQRAAIARAARIGMITLLGTALALAAASLYFVREAGIGDRVQLAQVSLAALAHRPVFGWGPDAFLAPFRQFRSASIVAKYGPILSENNAHSWPFQYATTLGVLGAALLVTALGLALWRARGAMRRGESSGGISLAAGIFVGCLGYAVHMLSSVAVLGATVPFWLLLGVLGGPAARRLELRRPALVAGGVAALTLTLAAVFVSGVLLSADHAFLLSRVAYREGRSADAIAPGRRAVALNPLSIKYRRSIAQIDIDLTMALIARKAPKSQILASWSEAERALAAAAKLDAQDYATWAWTAGLRAAVGQATGDATARSGAIEAANRAVTLDVNHVQVESVQAGMTAPAAVYAALRVEPLP